MTKPSKVIIVEGPRGGGKSSVCRALREQIEGSTLLNLTGFKLNGQSGLHKAMDYYDAWMNLMEHLESGYTLIFDRTFFSEIVYSKLYKDYDFSGKYKALENRLVNFDIDLYLCYLRVGDHDQFRDRLNRDKVALFDQIEESVEQSVRQQQEYDAVMAGFNERHGHRNNIKYLEIDTSHMSVNGIRDIILTATQ